MSPGFAVDPDSLGRVAADVEAVRDDHVRTASRVESATEELGRSLAGWRIGRTAGDTVLAWRDDAKRVTGWLVDYATALRHCAQDYRYGERVTAEVIHLFPTVR